MTWQMYWLWIHVEKYKPKYKEHKTSKTTKIVQEFTLEKRLVWKGCGSWYMRSLPIYSLPRSEDDNGRNSNNLMFHTNFSHLLCFNCIEPRRLHFLINQSVNQSTDQSIKRAINPQNQQAKKTLKITDKNNQPFNQIYKESNDQ